MIDLNHNSICSYGMLCHGEVMVEVFLIAFLCLLGPLAYVYGVDSRTGDSRGGWPGAPRR
jgi:hypothetical protein